MTEDSIKPKEQTFLMAKWAILRLIGLIYLITFLGASYQNPGLIGSNGLAPATQHMDRLRKSVVINSSSSSSANTYKLFTEGFLRHPTLFWFITGPLMDKHLEAVTTTGLILSACVAFLNLNSWLVMLLLWLIDFSIVTVAEGSSFYQYGWESQLLETGFLAIFLCDLPHVIQTKNGTYSLRGLWRDERMQANKTTTPPSKVVLYLFQWLCFRISMGAGLIKIRGSSCWTDKTCLHYHFETQPIPSPLSFLFHFLPKNVLSHAVNLDLFVQLYSVWIVLLPGGFTTRGMVRLLRRVGGWIQAGFMLNIILSGNFAFLNHLTIVPALSCLDDGCWPNWLQRRVLTKNTIVTNNTATNATSRMETTQWLPSRITRYTIDISLLIMIGYQSQPVIQNLLQSNNSRQQMNASFSPLRIVNTYGAFGSVGKARYEPIVSVSSNGKIWHELDFPCKPGNIHRRPCVCAPYHYRLDWNIWFIGFKPHKSMLERRESWLYALLQKMLDSNYDPNNNNNTKAPVWLNLLDVSAQQYFPPFAKEAPRFAKVEMYRYRMAAPLWEIVPQYWNIGHRASAGDKSADAVTWWRRDFEEVLIPPVELDLQSKMLRLATVPVSPS